MMAESTSRVKETEMVAISTITGISMRGTGKITNVLERASFLSGMVVFSLAPFRMMKLMMAS